MSMTWEQFIEKISTSTMNAPPYSQGVKTNVGFVSDGAEFQLNTEPCLRSLTWIRIGDLCFINGYIKVGSVPQNVTYKWAPVYLAELPFKSKEDASYSSFLVMRIFNATNEPDEYNQVTILDGEKKIMIASFVNRMNPNTRVQISGCYVCQDD